MSPAIYHVSVSLTSSFFARSFLQAVVFRFKLRERKLCVGKPFFFFCYFFTRLLKVGEDAVSSEGVCFLGVLGSNCAQERVSNGSSLKGVETRGKGRARVMRNIKYSLCKFRRTLIGCVCVLLV